MIYNLNNYNLEWNQYDWNLFQIQIQLLKTIYTNFSLISYFSFSTFKMKKKIYKENILVNTIQRAKYVERDNIVFLWSWIKKIRIKRRKWEYKFENALINQRMQLFANGLGLTENTPSLSGNGYARSRTILQSDVAHTWTKYISAFYNATRFPWISFTI